MLSKLLLAWGVRPLLKLLFRVLVYFKFYGPIVWFYSRIIHEVGGHSGLPTILAINSKRFRDDPQHLIETGKFRVLGLGFDWLAILGSQFYAPGMGRARYHPEADETLALAQKRYWEFLSEFLPRLYRKLGVDCVVSACIDYPQDFDWGVITHRTGTPFIIFHKENLATSPGMIERFETWSGSLGKFKGTHVIVHNDTVRQALIRPGYVQPDQISSLGCLRMDAFLNDIRNGKAETSTRERPLVTFFSFGPGIGLGKLFGGPRLWPDEAGGIGFFKAFRSAHIAIARLAQDHPDIDVIIKPKWGGDWIEKIIDVLHNTGIDIDDIPNLSIQPDVSAQDLIFSSTVVVSYGSTVQLEAAVAGKPVVVPFLDEMHEDRYQDLIFFRDQMDDLFDVARTDIEFRSIIEKRLKDPEISERCMTQRRKSFDSLVSCIQGGAADRYSDFVLQSIAKQKAINQAAI